MGYFSLETKPEKMIDRTVTAVCGVDFGRIKAHKLEEMDWREIEYRSTAMVGRKLEIIQAGGPVGGGHPGPGPFGRGGTTLSTWTTCS